MMCLPANFGWICSIINWFLIPIPFTPFNLIFGKYDYLWWLCALCDGAFTSGVVYLIYILNEYLEKKINYYENKTEKDINNIEGYDSFTPDNNFLVDDITLKK
jgi:hypothetical protein